MTISGELLDELLKGCERPEDLPGDAGLMKELKIRLMERMLGAELTAHPGHEEGKDARQINPTVAMDHRRRCWKAKTARCRFPFRATVMAVSSRSWSRRARPGSTGWTRRSSIARQAIATQSAGRGLCAAGLTVRHPCASRGRLRAEGVARSRQPRHRCRPGRSPGMAGPGARPDASDCRFRRAAGQDPRCRQPQGQEQGGLRGARRQPRRGAGGSG